ncbi:MAG: UDP-N-acetylmuramate--L-alanine ligase [Clostridia bacterium]|nr:UDP-N-acetylmuramate--L-alanine ligase [Clostridia bacterium]
MNRNDFEEFKNIVSIHMIGIGGISMSGIAVMLKKSGFEVTGSDSMGSDMVRMLEDENIPVFIGSNPELVHDADMVVYTAAINKATDKEYLEALKLNKPIYERAPFLGKLLKIYEKPICIAGMHGKTTTTSMVASALKTAGVEPTVLVGSRLKELNNLNYTIGDNKYFVLESCEYVDSFLNFPGDTSVILNIEEDHLDYFKDLENIKDSFIKFIGLIHENGNLVVNADNENVLDVVERAKDIIKEKNIHVYTYSTSNDKCDVYAKNITLADNRCYEFDVYANSNLLCHINLNAPGVHNVSNSLATIAVAVANNLDILLVKEGLEEFTGASRRFEYKKTIGENINVYDDYAHHPTEIMTTLTTAKEKASGRIIAVFEPHTYTRTITLFDKFANAFYDADIVILADIYAAREKDEGIVSSDMLADALVKNGVNAKNLHTLENIAKHIHEIIEPNDIVLTIGAGTITKLSNLL